MQRAMHSFVRKFPEYGLIGGKGRAGGLYLYERNDPQSAMAAKLRAQTRYFVPLDKARVALDHLQLRYRVCLTFAKSLSVNGVGYWLI